MKHLNIVTHLKFKDCFLQGKHTHRNWNRFKGARLACHFINPSGLPPALNQTPSSRQLPAHLPAAQGQKQGQRASFGHPKTRPRELPCPTVLLLPIRGGSTSPLQASTSVARSQISAHDASPTPFAAQATGWPQPAAAPCPPRRHSRRQSWVT